MAAATATSTQSTAVRERMRTQFVAFLLAVHNFLALWAHHIAKGFNRFFGLGVAPARGTVDRELAASMGVMRAVKMVGGGVIGIAVTVLVVNQVLTVDSINNSTGPFTSVIDSLDSTGVAAMTLLVVALLVAAASVIMDFMGGF